MAGRKMVCLWAMAVVIAASLATWAVAEEEKKAVEPTVAAPATTPGKGAPTPLAKPKAASRKKSKVMPPRLALSAATDKVVYDETPLPDVLGEIRKGGMGFRVSIAVDKSINTEDMLVTVNLRRVTARQALRAILRPHGLTYGIVDNYIYISTPEGVRKEMPKRALTYNVQDIIGESMAVDGLSRRQAERRLRRTLQALGKDVPGDGGK
jgi:Secretin and TonB N terminus short domain